MSKTPVSITTAAPAAIGPYPARAAVGAASLLRGALVEADAILVID